MLKNTRTTGERYGDNMYKNKNWEYESLVDKLKQKTIYFKANKRSN